MRRSRPVRDFFFGGDLPILLQHISLMSVSFPYRLALLSLCVMDLLSGQQGSRRNVLSLDGKSGYIEVPFDSLLAPAEVFTYELWARADRPGGEFQAPFSFRDNFVGVVFYIAPGGAWNMWIGNTSSWSPTFGPPVHPHQWTHIAVVYDHHHLTFYVDGQNVGESDKQFLQNRGRPLRFGIASDGFRFRFIGSVDDVRIWNTARTRDEILRSMLGDVRPDEQGLVAHWDFNDPAVPGADHSAAGRYPGSVVGSVRIVPDDRPLAFPLLSVDRDRISFASIKPGVRRIDTLSLKNIGTAPLIGRVSYSGDPDVHVDSLSIHIAPGERMFLPVRYEPAIDGVKRGIITISYNGPSGKKEVMVSADCRSPKIDTVIIHPENRSGIISGRNFQTLSMPQAFIGTVRVPIREQNDSVITVSLAPGLPFGPVSVTTFLMSVVSDRTIAIPSSVAGPLTPAMFRRSGVLPLPDHTRQISVVDLDGDARYEMIVADRLLRRLLIRPQLELHTESGKDREPFVVELPMEPMVTVAEDVDNDGKIDLVVAGNAPNLLVVFRNRSSIDHFEFHEEQRMELPFDPVAAALGDLNGDLKKDLILSGGVRRQYYGYRNASGYERCTFRYERTDNIPKEPTDVVIEDLDGDHRPDAVFSGNHEASLQISQNFSTDMPLVLEPAQIVLSGARTPQIAALDINGDGRPEMITLNEDANTISIYANHSDRYIRIGGRFDLPTGQHPVDMAFADLNGDGRPEIIVANEGGRSFTVFENRCEPGTLAVSSFGKGIDVPVDFHPGPFVVRDIDFDGQPDIVTIDEANHAAVFLRTAVEPSSGWWWIWTGSGMIALVLGIFGSVRYYELKRIRRHIAQLEAEQQLQDELSRKMVESQERERSRIAQELHDGLGQELLLIKNAALLALMKEKDDRTMRAELENLSGGVSRVIKIARDISYNLRPAELDRLGLSETLRSIVVELRRATDVRVTGEVETIDGLIPKDLEINVVRILQEATANAMKHSRAQTLHIAVTVDAGVITLSVADNGVGLPEQPNSGGGNSKGLGLAGIEERVRILRGTLSIAPTSGGGTTLTVTIPVTIARQETP